MKRAKNGRRALLVLSTEATITADTRHPSSGIWSGKPTSASIHQPSAGVAFPGENLE